MMKEFDFRSFLASILGTARQKFKPRSIGRQTAQYLVHDAIELSTHPNADVTVIATALAESIKNEEITC